jgi:hypothetical protein
VIVYAVVDRETERAVELFVRREEAEAMIAEVREDEQELATALRVEIVDLVAAGD